MLLENIEALCAKHNTNLSKLEKDLELGNATIRRWDESSPRLATLEKVARYFGVGLDELVNGKKKRRKEE